MKSNLGSFSLVGLQGPRLLEAEAEVLRRIPTAGILLLRRNIESRAALEDLIGALDTIHREEFGRRPLLAVDQEGGAVCALDGAIPSAPSAMALGIVGSPELTRRVHAATARILDGLNIQLALAPVADLHFEGNPVIGTRSFGTDAESVGRQVSAAIRGLQEGGTSACAKHWPGHGRTTLDSHLARPRIEATLEELIGSDLIPFVAAIQSGVDALMVGHLEFPALDAAHPFAPTSRQIVHGWLREKLGFDGAILGDALEMGGFGKEDPAASLRAGIDLLLFGRSVAELADVLDGAIPLNETEATASLGRIESLRRGRPPMALPVGPEVFEEARQAGAVALWPESRGTAPWPPGPGKWWLLDLASSDRLLRLPGVDPLAPECPEVSPLAALFEKALGPPSAPAHCGLPGSEMDGPIPTGATGWILASLRPWSASWRDALARAAAETGGPRWILLLGDPSLQASLPSNLGILLVPGVRPEDARLATRILLGEVSLESRGRWGD